MTGISPRYIFKCIAACFTEYDLRCITPIDILRSIKENFESNAKLSKDDIAKYDDVLTIVVEEYTKMAKTEVKKAFCHVAASIPFFNHLVIVINKSGGVVGGARWRAL